FAFNLSSTTRSYTLSLHDALPISVRDRELGGPPAHVERQQGAGPDDHACEPEERHGSGGELVAAHDERDRPQHEGGERRRAGERSEEHTSELQSRFDLVCRLLLEK